MIRRTARPPRPRGHQPCAAEALEHRLLLATYTVTNNGVAAGSLRQAITDANANAGADVIRFNLPAAQTTIRSALPEITGPLDIDGTTQPGYAVGRPVVHYLGPGTTSAVDGLVFNNAGACRVRGLIVNNFSGGSGIKVSGNTQMVIEGNWIGLDPSGTLPVSNKIGINILSNGARIGGTTEAQRNIISGNSAAGAVGVELAGDDNVVIGNYIGTTREGNSPLRNQVGVYVPGSRNRIGGTTAAELNVISGNVTGVYLGRSVSASVPTSLDNVVSGNYIGTNAPGNLDLPNTGRGVWVRGGSDRAIVGGTAPGAGNVIAGNREGVTVEEIQNFPGAPNVPSPRNTRIEGNVIGLGATGGVIANTTGVLIRTHSIIGGTTPAARNVISGNGTGLHVAGETFGIEGNYIGLNAAGTSARPNAVGILIDYNVTLVGGSTLGTGNVISGNTEAGIRVIRGGVPHLANPGTRIEGNRIGTNAAGTAAIGNGVGIELLNGTAVIGGDHDGARNVISGNNSDGVRVNASSGEAKIRFNSIGTNATNTAPLGNTGHGVFITATTSGRNVVDTNFIAHNGGDGIRVGGGAGNSFLSNLIYSNGGLGIDLGGDGVTANDAGDVDTGPNERQNFPVLTAVLNDGSSITVRGTINGIAAANSYRIQFFASRAQDPSSHGEAEMMLGETTVNVGATGTGTFDVTLLLPVPAGYFITATATGKSTGSAGALQQTSEFSRAHAVPPPDTTPPAVYGVFVNGTAWTETYRLHLETLGRGSRRIGFFVQSGPFQLLPLPWVNLNEVRIDFSEPVDVQRDDLTVRGGDGTYEIVSFNNEGQSAVWQLGSALRPGPVTLELKSGDSGVTDLRGKALDGEWASGTDNWPSGDAIAGGDFAFRMNVVPGDVNRSRSVNAVDEAEVRRRYGAFVAPSGQGSTRYSFFADVNGDGRINAVDVSLVRARMRRPLLLP